MKIEDSKGSAFLLNPIVKDENNALGFPRAYPFLSKVDSFMSDPEEQVGDLQIPNLDD